jgi:hypothetical protein
MKRSVVGPGLLTTSGALETTGGSQGSSSTSTSIPTGGATGAATGGAAGAGGGSGMNASGGVLTLGATETGATEPRPMGAT